MSEITKVSNVSRLPQVVDIILSDGKRTSINVMPRSRPELPVGSKVDPNWLALNPGRIIVMKPEPVKKKTEVIPVSAKSTPEVISKEQK